MIRLSFTHHAETVMAQRGIERAWIVRVVLAPDWIRPDTVDPALTRAFGRIPERDGRVLRVVYSRAGDDLRIVTAFLDRGARR